MRKSTTDTTTSLRKSEVMRQRLLEAATEVFAEQGYDGAAVSRIARRAGVTTGAIYAYFTNKAELLLEVIRARLDLQLEPYREMYASGEVIDTNDLFMQMIRDRMATDRPLTRAILLETFAAARRNPEVREVVQEWLREATDPISALVRQAQAEGIVDDSLHAPTVAWFYMVTGAGEAFTEAAGVRLPLAGNYLPLMQKVANALRGPSADREDSSSGAGGSPEKVRPLARPRRRAKDNETRL